jgi:hypothetical protein
MSDANSELVVTKAHAITLFNNYQDDDECVISLADNWEMFGYTTKGDTFRAFERCGFIEGLDYLANWLNMTNIRNGKELPTKPIRDYLMSPRTLEHFGMMLRNERGQAIREAYRECRKAVQSIRKTGGYESVDTKMLIAEIVPQIINAVVPECVRQVLQATTNNHQIQRQEQPKYVGDILVSSNALTRLRQHYVTCYGKQAGTGAFHRALSTACQQFGYVSEIGRYGLKVEPAAILDSRVVSYIQKSQQTGFELYEKRKGVRNRIQPAAGQLNFLNN